METQDIKSVDDPVPPPSLLRRESSNTSQSPLPRPRLWSQETSTKSPPTAFDDVQSSNMNPSSNSMGTLRSPSASSDSAFGPLSPTTQDRVFPIRSVVSMDPTPTPFGRGESGDGFPGMELHDSDASSSSRRQLRDSRRLSGSSGENFSDTPYAEMPFKAGRRMTETPNLRAVERQPARRRSPGNEQARKTSSSFAGDDEQRSAAGTFTLLNNNTTMVSESIHSVQDGDPVQSSTVSTRSGNDEIGSGLLTARFKHMVTDGDHVVITGRDGETLQRCEDEPIHIPGAVQGFGLLIALQEAAEGKLMVRIVSENSKRIIGYTPSQLFALENFCDILSEEQTDNLFDHLDFIRDEQADPAANGPEVFTLSIRSPTLKKTQKLWCAMHINDTNRDLVICEFELEDDKENPLMPATDISSPEPAQDTLHGNPTEEEFAESTVISSKPLRVLRSARKRKGEAAAMEVFNIMSQVQEQLASAPNLESFLKVLVGVVKELTGFHRCMVYQFDQAWNGKVVTELVDPRATKDLYKGLHFPASDIPKQARDLYKINKVRLLYDRDQETARLVCRTLEDLEIPLDLTYAYLRAISPIHIKYLANMAVRGSMSISINAFGELWGLIACHSYGPKGMRVSFPIRKMCRLIGDSASHNIERLSYASRLQARKLINTVPTAHNPSGYIIASSDDLLKLFDADYGLLSIRSETKVLGSLDQTQEALAMLEYLRLRKITSVLSSHDIRLDFPDLRYPPGFTVIAGLLLVPLSVGGDDFIVFLRRGQTREVKWAGNPYDKYFREGTEGYLEPRKSFKTWSEKVIGKCREWTEEQVETAAVLCLVYGKFIEVWRQKEQVLQNSQLTKLLLANSAHEVRTPLNAIINYLEIAMEGTLDQETRDNLAKSHSASKSLIYVINDLLDLTKAEEGQNLIKDEIFDLAATVREATDLFIGDAKRKQIEYLVMPVENPGVPHLVIGDQRRVRQAISNIVANAIQHTTVGSVRVELWLTEEVEEVQDHVDIDIVVQDTGVGMSTKQLDALFRDLEQVQSEADNLFDEASADDATKLTAGREDKRTLGLGLAFVARIVRNMNGQLRLKSEEGKGSRFVIQLGFDLPAAETEGKSRLSLHDNKTASINNLEIPVTPPIPDGELTLVHRSAQRPNISRRTSGNSLNSARSGSLRSFKSGSSTKSKVDRMIDSLQQTQMVSGDNSTLQRSSSRGSREIRHSSILSGRTGSIRSKHSNFSGVTHEYHESYEPDQSPSGEAPITDSGYPVKAVRMPDDGLEAFLPPVSDTHNVSRIMFEVASEPPKPIEPLKAENLQVLVAEDDMINSKIIQKRLEKLGHQVHLTINGEECASIYSERNAFFDIILMDMQMPIVDGLTSTKMIRSYEKTHSTKILSHRAALNGRVPIFAVSASLIEKESQKYVDAGFDGWILKPVDFKRLNVLLAGIVEEDTRKECLYQPGKWERGGWFASSNADSCISSTKPSGEAPSTAVPPESYFEVKDGTADRSITKEQDRLTQEPGGASRH